MRKKEVGWSWGKLLCFLGGSAVFEILLLFVWMSNSPIWKLVLVQFGFMALLFVAVDLLYPGFSCLKNLFAEPEPEDPIDELRDYVDDLEEKRIELSGNISKLRAQTAKVRRTIKQNTKEMEMLSLKVDYARRKQNSNDEALALNQIGRLKSLNDKYELMAGRMQDMEDMLSRIHDYTSYKLADTKNEVRMREQEYNAISGGYKAMMNARSIVSDEDRDDYQSADSRIDHELQAKIAEMETFMELSQPLFNDMDLQSAIYKQEGEKIYDRIMTEGRALLARMDSETGK